MSRSGRQLGADDGPGSRAATAPAGAAVSAPVAAPIAYYWGTDAYALERAARDFGASLASEGTPLEAWRAPAEDEGDAAESGNASRRRARLIDDIASHLATAPLFGGGTLVVVRQPGGMLRETAARERAMGLLGSVAPGNALCFLDLLGTDARGPAAGGALRDAVVAAGGHAHEFPALTRQGMQAWLMVRAGELGVRLEPSAADLLAERVGAHVREGDVDRRRQSELANAELEKLALYRPGGSVSRDDVAELVAEAIPASTWAFLDALGSRRAADASGLADRLLAAGAPLPLVVTQVHRRLRELLIVREHLNSGSRPADLARVMRLQPFRAQKLAEQAVRWSALELVGAISGLLDLDLRSKGLSLDGSTPQMGDARDALEVQAWIVEHLRGGPQGASARRS